MLRAAWLAVLLSLAVPALGHADATAVRSGATVVVTGTDAAEAVTALTGRPTRRRGTA